MGSLVNSIGGLLGNTPNGAGFQAQGISPEKLQQAYNTTGDAYAQQNALAQALAPQGQQGIDAQTQLSQALQQQAHGLGPNPAAAQLAATTGQNISSQGALMAGQRGAGANVGLIARQAAQQGAGLQQQAVGQNAVLQAQQQLAAQGQLQNLAATQVGQQTGAVGSLNQDALSNQGQLLGLQANANSTNQAMSAVNANNTAKTVGGLVNGLSGGLTEGSGGGAGGGAGSIPSSDSFSMPQLGSQFASAAPAAAALYSGGVVPNHLRQIHQLYHGGNYEHKEDTKLSLVPSGDRFKGGGLVPGKSKVNKDDPKNDTVDTELTPGEVVIDLDTLKSKGPIGDAARMVAESIQKKNGSNPKKEEGDFKNALKEAIKSRKNKDAA